MKSIQPVITEMDRHLRLVQINNEEQAEAKAAEMANRNLDFVQFQREAMDQFVGLIRRSPTAAQALTLMASKMSRQNAVTAPMEVLCEACGASRAAMSRAVKLLEAERWIQIVKLGGRNTYHLNARAFWTTGRSFKNSSDVFSAAIQPPKAAKGGSSGSRGIKSRSVPVLIKKQPRSGPKP